MYSPSSREPLVRTVRSWDANPPQREQWAGPSSLSIQPSAMFPQFLGGSTTYKIWWTDSLQLPTCLHQIEILRYMIRSSCYTPCHNTPSVWAPRASQGSRHFITQPTWRRTIVYRSSFPVFKAADVKCANPRCSYSFVRFCNRHVFRENGHNKRAIPHLVGIRMTFLYNGWGLLSHLEAQKLSLPY